MPDYPKMPVKNYRDLLTQVRQALDAVEEHLSSKPDDHELTEADWTEIKRVYEGVMGTEFYPLIGKDTCT